MIEDRCSFFFSASNENLNTQLINSSYDLARNLVSDILCVIEHSNSRVMSYAPNLLFGTVISDENDNGTNNSSFFQEREQN
jgi:hypothetical protein